jgi:hypothetical protein
MTGEEIMTIYIITSSIEKYNVSLDINKMYFENVYLWNL